MRSLLMICGVRVPHTRGFLAHSDGDVGCMRWSMPSWARCGRRYRLSLSAERCQMESASSDRFLKYAVDRVTARGGRIAIS